MFTTGRNVESLDSLLRGTRKLLMDLPDPAGADGVRRSNHSAYRELGCSQPTNVRDCVGELFLAVTNHSTAVNYQCQNTCRLFKSLVEAQVKEQVRSSGLAWLSNHHETAVPRPDRLNRAARTVT